MTIRRAKLKNAEKIVIKLGTRLLTYSTGKLNLSYIEKIVRQIADLKNQDKKIILVSSGAVGAGIGKLGIKKKGLTIPERQAMAAIGQGLIIQFYEKIFAEYGYTVAQILLTRLDFENRKRFINAHNTFEFLLNYDVIPIVNENDTVSTEEIELGDNDQLSALVASLIDADLLINLTDTEGLYDSNPALNPKAKLIPLVSELSPDIKKLAGETNDSLSTGGMITKLLAAEIALSSGIDMVIANGQKQNVLQRLLDGEEIGTFFSSSSSQMKSRKKWIAFGQTVKGIIVIDEGAEKAIMGHGKSLLPIGIIEVSGSFSKGETVSICTKDGNELARGLVNYSSEELQLIKGKKTQDIEDILGYCYADEIIHRNNMVIY